ncbi:MULTISPECIES: glycoside hydrolase family 2 TIM barrel-domain containing protein [Pseudofrankia]|uniref:glycoside hydrolase family 2 TIM barrel-domain containing protein n=1 Tax=Pseudofrankia TaxID=2994363 RepID=UPI000234C78F|nr:MULTISPECIES: glycoside hydrolase family 2 TIM barrel-domain containing protein [Pseudofrankia]OHV29160.1 glycoside hydrolase [Pseudofrankia sp. EUN1h]
MIRTSFNDGWFFRPKAEAFLTILGQADTGWEPVRLPHDAMVHGERDSTDTTAAQRGYFPAGAYEYKKTFFVPDEYRHRRVTFEFEGVYRNARVYLNGDLAGRCANGYSNFQMRADHLLRYGQDNEILVDARSQDDTRWYSGGGIYRNVKILLGGLVYVAPDGVRVTTPVVDDEFAVVTVSTEVRNEAAVTRTVDVVTEIVDVDGAVVGKDVAPATLFPGTTETVRQRLTVAEPGLWSVDDPFLYTCRTSVRAGDELLDEDLTRFGIRTLGVDPHRGFRLNGRTVKLRGACIHHDNGVIGAATIDRAEERRVEILKQAGFNAIRSGHNPISKALLDACDRLGMLVVDELFDTWTRSKSGEDYALDFTTWWESDVRAMVDKDFNHPSVVLYSIGNEIPETGSAAGAALGRRIAEKVRALDGTRLVTNAVNGLLAGGPELFAAFAGGSEPQSAENVDVNTFMTQFREFMPVLMTSDVITSKTAEAMSYLDVAGYNYLESRYAMDRALFPNRVILGTETFPSDIDTNWRLVQDNSHVIGDFTWTGWDYLGEPGLGRIEYQGEGTTTASVTDHQAAYPWLAAWCGDLDITGHRRPASYYREIVFGLRSEPYLAVHRPARHGQPVRVATWWSWTDSISSWTWDGHEGRPIHVDVYSAADEVELLVNGRSLGIASAGEKNRFRAEFETVYEPGEILAVAYTDGEEIGRTVLRSASGEVRLRVEADRAEIGADDGDLAFISITLVDQAGNFYNTADRPVSVELTGPGELQGFGSADPKPTENFFDTTRTTFDGRALAVIRPTAPGTVSVTLTARECTPSTVRIEARPRDAADPFPARQRP